MARSLSGLALFAVVAAIVLLDAFRTDFSVDPFVLMPILLTASTLVGADVDRLRESFARRLESMAHNPAKPSRRD